MTAAGSRSSLSIIFLTVFVDLLGFGIVLPLLPYYAHQFHASGAVAGALIAVYSAMQLVCAPLWGQWSDSRGRRPVILLSLAGSTVSYLLFACADGIGLLFVSRVLAGVAGANIPVAQAFIADTTSEQDRSRGMGLIGAAFGLGFIFGPAIGGLLAHYGHHAPGLAAFAICGLNLIAAYWRLPESLTPELKRRRTITHPLQQWRAALAAPHLATPLLLFATVVFAFSTMETTLALLCATSFGLEPSQIYWLFGFMGVVTTVLQGGVIGRLARHVDEASLVVGGTVLLALGLGSAPFTRPLWPLLAALAAIAIGQGIASPVLASLISKMSPPKERGGVLGLSQSLGSLARIFGPIWGGVLFDAAGAAGPYVTTAALMAGAAVVALTWLPHAIAGVPASSAGLKSEWGV